ncbi:hypothetical protein EDD11_005475, partial [Mortierella claussenii]
MDYALKGDNDVTSEQLELLSISDAPPATPNDDHSCLDISTHQSGDAPSVQHFNLHQVVVNQLQQIAVDGAKDVMNKQVGLQRDDQSAFQPSEKLGEMIARAQKHLTESDRDRIQAVLSQTYELHENTLPRLFIVLPKTTIQRKNQLDKPSVTQFRLFFLCECGAHTGTSGSRTTQKIHLATHKGYDLDQQDEFFEKYGTYILTILQMMKYDAAAATMAVPALASLDLANWLDSVKDILATGGGLEPLVDSSIDYIQKHRQKIDIFEKDQADLRRLGQYLKDANEGQALGDLFRIVTWKGHVKWVCIDHFNRYYYQQPSMMLLTWQIGYNNGTQIKQLGEVVISFRSSVLAKRFYRALAETRNIHDLDVTLGWNATLDDLSDFEAAVTKANIVRLKLDGSHLMGLEPPLVKLLYGRIQSITFRRFNDFFDHAVCSSMAMTSMTSRLRYLSFSLCGRNHRSSILVPQLIELWLSGFGSSTALLSGTFEVHESLNKSHFEFQDATFDTTYFKGKIVGLIAALDSMDSVNDPTYRRILETGQITKLQVKESITERHQKLLKSLLRLKPAMEEIDFNGDKRCANILDLVLSTRETMLAPGSSDGCAWKKVAFLVSWDTLLEVTFPDTSHPDSMSIKIDLSALDDQPSDFDQIFRQYGSYIVSLDASRNLEDGMVRSFADAIIHERSTLRSLVLSTSSISATSLGPMEEIIARSSNLEYFSFTFDEMSSGCEKSMVRWWVKHCVGKTTTLVITEEMAATFIDGLSSDLQNKNALPRLTELGISGNILEKDKVNSVALWITGLKPGLVSLKHIRLTHMRHLGYEWWAKIIKAMDFTTLEHVDFSDSDFCLKGLQVLNECLSAVEKGPSSEIELLPLKNLVLWNASVVAERDGKDF